MKQAMIEKLKQHFNLPQLTMEEWKDKYGKIIYIKELGFETYKRDFNNAAEELIESEKFATSGKALECLKAMAERDNMFAKKIGKREYEVVNVFMSKSFVRFGVTIKFKDNGETRNVIESGLDSGLRNEKRMMEYLVWYHNYFTAGGLRDDEVDFIFHGVGHSSTNDMYSRTNEELFYKA